MELAKVNSIGIDDQAQKNNWAAKRFVLGRQTNTHPDLLRLLFTFSIPTLSTFTLALALAICRVRGHAILWVGFLRGGSAVVRHHQFELVIRWATVVTRVRLVLHASPILFY